MNNERLFTPIQALVGVIAILSFFLLNSWAYFIKALDIEKIIGTVDNKIEKRTT